MKKNKKKEGYIFSVVTLSDEERKFVDKQLFNLSEEPSIEELMRTDYDKLIDLIEKYTTYDKRTLKEILDVSPVTVDAIAMNLSALQYIVSEGGLIATTYELLPFRFKIKEN